MGKNDKLRIEGSLVSRSRALKKNQDNRKQSPKEAEKTNRLKNVVRLTEESAEMMGTTSAKNTGVSKPPNVFKKPTKETKPTNGTGESRVTIVQLICRSSLRENLTEGECLDQP